MGEGRGNYTATCEMTRTSYKYRYYPTCNMFLMKQHTCPTDRLITSNSGVTNRLRRSQWQVCFLTEVSDDKQQYFNHLSGNHSAPSTIRKTQSLSKDTIDFKIEAWLTADPPENCNLNVKNLTFFFLDC